MFTPAIAMQAARLRDSFGDYLVAQLKAEPALNEIANFFCEAQQRLSGRMDAHERARRVSLNALAARDRVHDRLDDAVRFFGYAVRASAIHDARAPLYRHYFPGGTPGVTRSPLRVTVLKVVEILAKLATEERPDLKVHAAPLAEALEAMRLALDGRAEAKLEESRAWAALVAEKRHWRDAYQQVHARLRLHFHDEPRRAENYYRRVRASRPDEAGPVADEIGAAAWFHLIESGATPPSSGIPVERAQDSEESLRILKWNGVTGTLDDARARGGNA